MSIFRKLGWFFRQEKKHYLIGIFSLFAVALVQLVPPKVIGIIIDEIADKNLSIKIISWWILLLILAALLQYLFRYIWRTNIWGSAARLEKELRQQLFKPECSRSWYLDLCRFSDHGRNNDHCDDFVY